jgi:hypothetical protein
MPYITRGNKLLFDKSLSELLNVVFSHGLSNGELNYLITQLGLMYLDRHGKSYNTISDVVKAMECAKLEFYRRVAAPYEDNKIRENGDVYE